MLCYAMHVRRCYSPLEPTAPPSPPPSAHPFLFHEASIFDSNVQKPKETWKLPRRVAHRKIDRVPFSHPGPETGKAGPVGVKMMAKDRKEKERKRGHRERKDTMNTRNDTKLRTVL